METTETTEPTKPTRPTSLLEAVTRYEKVSLISVVIPPAKKPREATP